MADYMVRDGVTYVVVSDQLGSARVVADAATGKAVIAAGPTASGIFAGAVGGGAVPFYIPTASLAADSATATAANAATAALASYLGQGVGNAFLGEGTCSGSTCNINTGAILGAPVGGGILGAAGVHTMASQHAGSVLSGVINGISARVRGGL